MNNLQLWWVRQVNNKKLVSDTHMSMATNNYLNGQEGNHAWYWTIAKIYWLKVKFLEACQTVSLHMTVFCILSLSYPLAPFFPLLYLPHIHAHLEVSTLVFLPSTFLSHVSYPLSFKTLFSSHCNSHVLVSWPLHIFQFKHISLRIWS